MNEKRIACNIEGIGLALDFIEDELTSHQLKRKNIQQAMLLAEESMVKFIEKAPENAQFRIGIRKQVGGANIKIQAPGEKIDTAESSEYDLLGLDVEGLDRDGEMTIRNMVLQSFADRIRYKHKNQYNTVQVIAGKPERTMTLITCVVLLASVTLGLLMYWLLPQSAADAISQYLLNPIETMFLSALRLIFVPVAFFSIVSCTAQCTSFSGIGKIGGKVLGLYGFTSLLAAGMGIGVFALLQPGTKEMLPALASQVDTGTVEVEMSAIETIIGIIPTNILRPFFDEEPLQIIFVALLVGIAVGMIGDYSTPLRDFFEACNTLFLKIMSIVAKFIPLGVFGATTGAILNLGPQTALALLELLGTFIVGLLGMVLVYCLFILLIARLSPLRFLKKYAPHLLFTFKLGSSSEAMPETIRCCRDRLGISPKVYSFSLPLGTLINMDASCVYLTVGSLFLAKTCGMELPDSSILPMVFTAIILSSAAPNALGANLISLAVLIGQLNVPLEALGLVIGVDTVMAIFCAASNTLGDVAVTLVTARTEKQVDLSIYKKK